MVVEDKHKFWLIAGISIAIMAVAILFLYPVLKGPVFGKAISAGEPGADILLDLRFDVGPVDGQTVDSSIYGHEAVVGGGSVLPDFSDPTRGRHSGAYVFTGSQDVYVTDVPELDLGAVGQSYSVEAWFKPDGVYAGTIISKQSASVIEYPYNCFIENSGLLTCDFNGGGYISVRSNSPPQGGEWYHLVFVVDRSSSPTKIRLYLNGQFQEQNDISTSISAQNDVYTSIGANFAGVIDEARIYSRALTEGEIAQLSQGVLLTPEICSNELDDDLDGVADCEDDECQLGPECNHVELSTANGHWVPLTTIPPSGTVESFQSHFNELYTGTYGGGVYRYNSVYYRWDEMNNQLGSLYVRSLHSYEGQLYAGTDDGIYRYDLALDEWSRIESPFSGVTSMYFEVTSMYFEVTSMYFDGDKLYAGTFGNGVWVNLGLDSGGVGWNDASNGLSNRAVSSLYSYGGELYAATMSGVYRYDRILNQWARMTNMLDEFNVWSLYSYDGDLYAGTNNGVYRYNKLSNTWDHTGSNVGVWSLYSYGGELYAGTNSGGVYRYNPSFNNWDEMNNQLAGYDVKALYSYGSELYAGMFDNDGGVYHYYTIPQCENGVQDGEETGVDCGGSLCLVDCSPEGVACACPSPESVCNEQIETLNSCELSSRPSCNVVGERACIEICDDNIDNDLDGLTDCADTSSCTSISAPYCRPSWCGDGAKQTGESCDDGNTADGDGCNSVCNIEEGFACQGISLATSTCYQCGDGIVEPIDFVINTGGIVDVNCDDSNTYNGDGCSSLCSTETGYQCNGGPSLCIATASTADSDGDGILDVDDYCTRSPIGRHLNGRIIGQDNIDSYIDSYDRGCIYVSFNQDNDLLQGELDNCPLADNAILLNTVAGGVFESNTGRSGHVSSITRKYVTFSFDDGFSLLLYPGDVYTFPDGEKIGVLDIMNNAPLYYLRFAVIYLGQNDQDHDGIGDACDLGEAPPGPCGNSEIEGREACDDGNTADGDGCSSVCGVDLGYVCNGEPSDCQPDKDNDGIGNAADFCLNTPLGTRVDDSDVLGCYVLYSDADRDGDALQNQLDNCPLVQNAVLKRRAGVGYSQRIEIGEGSFTGFYDVTINQITEDSAELNIVKGGIGGYTKTMELRAGEYSVLSDSVRIGVLDIENNINVQSDKTVYFYLGQRDLDKDGLGDACDTEVTTLSELCNNNIDDDFDGTADCADNDCQTDPVCSATNECGDGILQQESCDDGDIVNGDGCSASCAVEAGYECIGEPSSCNVQEGWIALNTGLSGLMLYGSAITVHNGGVYIGTLNGVYRYDGSTWVAMNNGLVGGDLHVNSVLSYNGELYIATGGSEDSVYHYDGSTWIPVGNLPDVSLVNLISHDGKLYVGTYFGGVYRYDSPNWVTMNNGLPYDPPTTVIMAYGINLISSVNGGLYLGMVGSDSQGGVYQYDLPTASWVHMTEDGLSHYSGRDVYSIISHDGELYIGAFGEVYRYDGSRWISVMNGLSATDEVHLFTGSDGYLYAGTHTSGVDVNGGMYVYDSGTAIWDHFSAGLASNSLQVNAIAEWNGNLYIATRGGIYYRPLIGGVSLTGDVNNDGCVNILDITQIAYNVNLACASTPTAGLAGDVNNDGCVNILDITQIAYNVNLQCI